jgi:predicted O-methyltransferase YrrM
LVKEAYACHSDLLPDELPRRINASIPKDEGHYLYSLVRHLRPALSIEVGMANGLSALFIAQALQENGVGRHIAIDPFQLTDWKGVGMNVLRRAGLDRHVQLVERPSHQVLPELEWAGLRGQFIFIDGNHMFDYVVTDFLCADRLLDVGGLIAFDDADFPAILQTVRFVLANRHYEVAFPDVVVQRPRIAPTLLGRCLRGLGRRIPVLGGKLRPDFLVPSDEIGVQGRCVVLRKLGHDDRDNQSRFHQPF